jgi:phosphoenolpyruvate carboxykinase (diphosphate)
VDDKLTAYINLKLAALGQPTSRAVDDAAFLDLAGSLLRSSHQKDKLLSRHLCPVDARIQSFLDDMLRNVPGGAPRLPSSTFVLDQPGLGRILSIPAKAHLFKSTYLTSYRLPQGVLHNPKSDRRTTQGLFHIAENGLPIPDDKAGVPMRTFAALLQRALTPPDDLMTLPFTSDQPEQARLFVSLLMRPLVCPVTGSDPAKTLEIRFFAPGSFVSNLDFVEAIFGNAGDPSLPENDSALDVEHWTGHTGCVIVAPHIIGQKKKDLGLPPYDQATERQRRDGMYWKDENDIYNEGRPFKVTCRDQRGVIVTVIADNYFGYCKKEVKTQISFSANLFGLAEEEHAGGALAFPSYILGQAFYANNSEYVKKASFADAMKRLGDRVDIRPEGYAVDRRYPEIFYVPEDSSFHAREGAVRWKQNNVERSLPLRAGDAYVLPSGYKIRLEKQKGGRLWRLVGTRPEGTHCHKPCTVSGGGKSEISKSISVVLNAGPVYVKDFAQDMQNVAEILKRDFSTIYRVPRNDDRAKRPLLSLERSIGSVVKLLTPSPDYTDEHNEWVRKLPQTIRQLVFVVKRYYQPEWGDNWREHFTVDSINGYLAHELKFENEPLIGHYLRVGYDVDGSWRMFKLRPDYDPADKVQTEDDITASVVLPSNRLPYLDPEYKNPSAKLVANCEAYLFQRPDDAIHRGFDLQAEEDIATPGTFLSNFQPLTVDEARKIVNHMVEFDRYSEPMKKLLEDFIKNPSSDYVVSSAHPRLVDGVPSKNPRYLQKRPDLVNHRDAYLADIGTRLHRAMPTDATVYHPVNAVLAGRRNNPPNKKIGLPPLAVYNPIHFQELPELFMDFICSLTGKSPSTTGFGSEGALTKGPFNALWPVVDLNNALLSMILTAYPGFSSAAGHVGPKYQVDHDISMLVPEIWCRMKVDERDPAFLIKHGYLEPVKDFEFQGRKVFGSRLGYRITLLFADRFLGRLFDTPNTVFSEEMLKPEKQDLAVFAEGIDSIVEGQQRVARHYINDGSVEAACPPLRAMLYIMANGTCDGMDAHDPKFRALFNRETVVASDWYKERLLTKQNRDIALWRRHLASLETYRSLLGGRPAPLDLEARAKIVKAQSARVSSPDYLTELVGTIGADPFLLQIPRETSGSKQEVVSAKR